MASTEEYVQLILEQISPVGNAKCKKMFGEYMVYLNMRPIFLICNDTLYVKILPQTTAILGEDCEQAYPYDGAKLRYVIDDVEDNELLQKLAIEVEKVTPLPKPRKSKSS